MTRILLPWVTLALIGQELTEQQREEERRRQKMQEDRARQQIEGARRSVNRIEGQVFLVGGGAPPDRVTVALVCGDQTADRQFADSKGKFGLTLPDTTASACQVEAFLLGFRAEPARLDQVAGSSTPALVRLVLRPVAGGGEPVVSATTLAASREARKAYDKGLQELERNKYVEAEKDLREAASLHPRFALAWYALGRVYSATNRPTEARTALEQAVAADARFFSPYPMLAQLDLNERRWEALAAHTRTAITLQPGFSADLYLLSGQANLTLGRLDVAETHTRDAMRLDTTRKYAVAHRLLAAILAKQGRNREAAQALRAFLEAAPAADHAAIREEIERLEASVQTTR